MFGLNLLEFLEENLQPVAEYEQDIYYDVGNDKFFIHEYFGNETLESKDCILIYRVPSYLDLGEFCGCEHCSLLECCEEIVQNESEEDRYIIGETSVSQWKINKCTYHTIDDNLDYDYLEEYGIIDAIKDRMDCEINELMELETLLEYYYGSYHEYVARKFGGESELYLRLQDEIIDNVVANGFGGEKRIGNNWLDGHIQHLLAKWVENPYDERTEKISNELSDVADLLNEFKISEALELLKESD